MFFAYQKTGGHIQNRMWSFLLPKKYHEKFIEWRIIYGGKTKWNQ